MGEVAVNSKDGQIKPQIVPISLNNQYNEIIVQVSNYGYDEGGFIVNLLLGETMQLVNLRERNTFRDVFVFGSILFMGLYHFTWFITIREDKSNLFFGFICILISIRVLLMGEMLLYSFLPDTCLCRKLSTFTLSMGLFFMAMFIRSLYPDETHLRFVRFVQATSGFYSLIVLVTPEIISILFYSVYEFIAFAVVIYLSAAVVRAVFHKRTGALLVLSAFGILFTACINDLLTQLGIFRTGYYIPQGFTLFIYVQAFMLADKFRKMTANEEKLLKSELRTLQAQIKPHFLFNVLNTIIHMCRVSPEKALNLLTSLNIYLQCSFSFKNDEEFISLKQEIKHVTSYLEIEKVRFRERLQVEFDIQGEIECNIPPLLEHLRLGGWVEANGQTLAIKEYYMLYAVVGSKYNINLSSEEFFMLPDLRGLFVRGVQNVRNNGENRAFLNDEDALNGKRLDYNSLQPISPSEEQSLLGSLQKDAFEEHAHQINRIAASFIPDSIIPCQVFSDTGTNNFLTARQGGVETRPTNIALYFLIKASYNLLKTGNNLLYKV